LELNNEVELQNIESQISPVIEKAESYVVNTIADVDNASSFLKEIKDMEKTVENKRLTFTKPLNESLKNINDTFKNMREPLEKARGLLTGKILTWKRAEAERVAAEQAAYRKIQEAEAELRRLQDKPEIIEEPITVAPVVNKIGNMQTVKRWTFDVEDFSKVPDEYKIIENISVRNAIRNGIRDIPGLNIFQEESLSIVGR
jgi:hypothetical protein